MDLNYFTGQNSITQCEKYKEEMEVPVTLINFAKNPPSIRYFDKIESWNYQE